LSTQQTQVGPTEATVGVQQVRASDADRDRAADVLNAAFAEGRLTADEHAERLSFAYAARTWQQLRQLTEDLPRTADPAAAPMAAPGTFTEADRCLLCVLLIVCPPAGIAWWWFQRRVREHPAWPLSPASDTAVATELPPAGRAGRAMTLTTTREGLHAEDR
jgi:uncharacterized protein DUF1707